MFCTESGKTVKKMYDRKTAGNYDLPGDVVKLLKEGRLKLLTKHLINIYELGDWPKDLTHITMTAIK
jgi:hypothetical protein